MRRSPSVRCRNAGDLQRLATELAYRPAAARKAGPELVYRQPGLEHQQLMRRSTCLILPAREHEGRNQKLVCRGIGPIVPDRTQREIDCAIILLIRQVR